MDNHFFLSTITAGDGKEIEVMRSILYPTIAFFKKEDIKRALASALIPHYYSDDKYRIAEFAELIDHNPIDDELNALKHKLTLVGQNECKDFIYGFSKAENAKIVGKINMCYSTMSVAISDVNDNTQQVGCDLTSPINHFSLNKLAESLEDHSKKLSYKESFERLHLNSNNLVNSHFYISGNHYNKSSKVENSTVKKYDIVSRSVLGAMAIPKKVFEESLILALEKKLYLFDALSLIKDEEKEFNKKEIKSIQLGVGDNNGVLQILTGNDEIKKALQNIKASSTLYDKSIKITKETTVFINVNTGEQYIKIEEDGNTVLIKGQHGGFQSSNITLARNENITDAKTYKEEEYFAIYAKTNNTMSDPVSLEQVTNRVKSQIKNNYIHLLKRNEDAFLFKKLKDNYDGEIPRGLPENEEEEKKLIDTIAKLSRANYSFLTHLNSGFFIKVSHHEKIGTFWGPKTKSPKESFSFFSNKESYFHGLCRAEVLEMVVSEENTYEYIAQEVKKHNNYYKALQSEIKERESDSDEDLIIEYLIDEILETEINAIESENNIDDFDFSFDLDFDEEEEEKEEEEPIEEIKTEKEEIAQPTPAAPEENIEEEEEEVQYNETELIEASEPELKEEAIEKTEPNMSNDNDDFDLDFDFDFGFNAEPTKEQSMNDEQLENKELDNNSNKKIVEEEKEEDAFDIFGSVDSLFEEPEHDDLKEEEEEETVVVHNKEKEPEEKPEKEMSPVEKFRARMKKAQEEKEQKQEKKTEPKTTSPSLKSLIEKSKKTATKEEKRPEPKVAAKEEKKPSTIKPEQPEQVFVPAATSKEKPQSVSSILGVSSSSSSVDVAALQAQMNGLKGNENIKDIRKLLAFLETSVAASEGDMSMINYNAVLNRIAAISLMMNNKIKKCNP